MAVVDSCDPSLTWEQCIVALLHIYVNHISRHVSCGLELCEYRDNAEQLAWKLSSDYGTCYLVLPIALGVILTNMEPTFSCFLFA